MTTSVELGDNDRLYIKADRHMLRMHPGVGGICQDFLDTELSVVL